MGAVSGESARHLDDLFAGPLPDAEERTRAAGALLNGSDCATPLGWEQTPGAVSGQYDIETALKKAPSDAVLWRKVSVRTKPRGHVKV